MPLPASDEPDVAPPRLTPAVLWLVALNVAVYFVQVTVQGDLPQWLGFRAGGGAGGFERHWWTALTYMFVHAGVWHLAFNMYMLWAFGPRVERAWSTRSFLGYYLWCGLGGVVTHALLVRDGALLVGASGAIYGVLLAYALAWPNEEAYLFGVVPMRVKWMVGMFILIDLVAGLSEGRLPDGSGTAHWAHLGGAFFGFLYALRPSAPNVERLRQRVASAPDLGDDPPRPVPRSLPRPRERGSDADEVVEKSKAVTARPARQAPAQPRRPVPAGSPARSEALDLVLDKISQHGLDSLTSDERRLLEEMSRKLRDT
jgi:membrane associated rhomboid family serine protease